MRHGRRRRGLAASLAALVLIVACGDTSESGSQDESPLVASTGGPSASMFDPATLHEIGMEIRPEDLARLDPPTDERVPVRLSVDGVTVETAGVRLKGGGAQYQPVEEKPGFSIKTDEFVDDRSVFDVSRFTLGNASLDASFVAEHLTYVAFRDAGIPVARTALARVTLNGETLGLYVMRESYDKHWLGRHFADPEGNLYESPGDGESTDTDLEPRTNEGTNDASDLDTVAAVVEHAPDWAYRTWIEQLVDVDQLLTYWSVEALVGHWDGYLYDVTMPGRVPPPARPPGNPAPNNFYAYHDPTSDRFFVIPHGADLTLGLGGGTWDLAPTAPVLTPPKRHATVAVRLWETPDFRTELGDRIASVLDDVWDPASLIDEAELLADHVRRDGLAGTRERIDLTEFEEALADREGFIRARGPAVRTELADEAAETAERRRD